VTRVEVPDFMAEVVAELSQLARQSPHLNQRSGVSVRLTIANYETLTANATRRALRAGETEVVPRVSDLQSLVASTQGKVEIETLEEGREDLLMSQLVSAAVLVVFRRRVVLDDPQGVVAAFSEDTVVHAGDDLPSSAYAETLTRMPVLSGPVLALAGSEDPAVVASALEFVLEGLHLTKRLNKEAAGARATYRGRG
jgi:magnesium chelatase subunit I